MSLPDLFERLGIKHPAFSPSAFYIFPISNISQKNAAKFYVQSVAQCAIFINGNVKWDTIPIRRSFMKRRFLALLLTGMMTAALLGGCGPAAVNEG